MDTMIPEWLVCILIVYCFGSGWFFGQIVGEMRGAARIRRAHDRAVRQNQAAAAHAAARAKERWGTM